MTSKKVLVSLLIAIVCTLTDIGITHVYASRGDDAKDLVQTIAQKLHVKHPDALKALMEFQRAHPTPTTMPTP